MQKTTSYNTVFNNKISNVKTYRSEADLFPVTAHPPYENACKNQWDFLLNLKQNWKNV